MKCYCVVLLTLWPWPLTFEPRNSITSSISQDYSLHEIWTLWDHSFLSYAADKPIDKQTDSKILPTPTDIVGMLRVDRRRRWLTSKSSFSRQCVHVGRIRDTCSQLTWKSHSPHTHGGTFWPTLTHAETLYFHESCQNKHKSEVCKMATSLFVIRVVCSSVVFMIHNRVAQKTVPSYLIANVLKIPWPNFVEIGELLQYYMLNTVIDILFKNFIAL